MDESSTTYGPKHLVAILIRLSIRMYTSFFINWQKYTHTHSLLIYIETDINYIVSVFTKDETSHRVLHFGANIIFFPLFLTLVMFDEGKEEKEKKEKKWRIRGIDYTVSIFPASSPAFFLMCSATSAVTWDTVGNTVQNHEH